MTPSRLPSLLARPSVAVALAGALALGLAGCGGSASPAADAPETSIEAPFEEVDTADGATTYAGHAIAFTLPEDWEQEYEETFDGQAYSWELHAPEGDPFPPFLNFTVNTEEEGGSRVREVAEAARGVAKTTEDGYEEVSFEEAEVDGAEEAWRYEFRREMNLAADDQNYPVEQEMLFFRTPDGHVVTVRFIAPDGTFEDTGLPEIRDSVVVREG